MFTVNHPNLHFKTRTRGPLSSNVIQMIEKQHEIKLKRDKGKLYKPSRYDLMVRGLNNLAHEYNYSQMSEIQQVEFDRIVSEACIQFIVKGKIKYDRDSMYYNEHSAFWQIFFNKLNSVKTLDLFTQAAAAVLTEGPIPDIQHVNTVVAGVQQANQELDGVIYAVRGLTNAMGQMSDKVLTLAEEESNATDAICESANVILERLRVRQMQRQALSRFAAQPTGRVSSRAYLNAPSASPSGLATVGMFPAPINPASPSAPAPEQPSPPTRPSTPFPTPGRQAS